LELVRVGYGNFVPGGRVETVLSPTAAPVQRLIRHARDEGLVIDLTAGRRTRAIALLDSGKLLLLGLTPKELGTRGLPIDSRRPRRRTRAR
jgi:regulator of extracellular matrix RemA (YlzA/DUF370 family)